MAKPFWPFLVSCALFCSFAQSQTMGRVSNGWHAFFENYQNPLVNTGEKSLYQFVDINNAVNDSLTFNRCFSQFDAANIFFRDNFFLGPSYFHFGDKYFHVSMWGGKLDYSYKLNQKFALTVDLGLYAGSRPKGDSLEGGKVNINLWTIGGGMSYYPTLGNTKLNLNMHLLAGIAGYSSKADLGYGTISTNKTSFC